MNHRPISVLLSVATVFLLSNIYIQCCAQTNETDIKKIYLALMLPYPDPLGRASFTATYDDGHDITPAAYLAVEQINNRTDILQGYQLELVQSDGGCTITERTVYSFAKDFVHGSVPLVGIIGPSCGDSAKLIAELTSSDRISLVSLHYGGGSAFFNYNNTFGILGSVSAFGDAFFELTYRNNWKRVAILHSLTAEGFKTLFRLKERSDHKDVDVHMAPVTSNFIPIQTVRELFIRVIYLVLSPEQARRILCLAFHQKMIYPNYQWIFEELLDQDFYGTNFRYDGQMYSCSDEDIFIALKGSFNFFFSLRPPNNSTITFSGLTYPQYVDAYMYQAKRHEERFNVNSTPTFWADPVYDAAWSFALALNYSLEEIESKNLSFTRSQQARITEIIQENMFKVNYQGITGEIGFDRQTRFLKVPLNLFQYDSDNRTSKRVGQFKSGKLTILSLTIMVVNDSFPAQNNHLNQGIATLYLILSVFALLVAIPIQIINVVYRKHKSIKASSHKLNHIVFIGCYIVILGIIVHTFNKMLSFSDTGIHTMFCNIFMCCCNIGPTLVFATVLIKTWRLYYIFTSNGQPRKRLLIKDETLALVVGVFISVELIVTILWMVVAPMIAFERTYLNDFRGSVPVIVSVINCHSEWTLACLVTLGVYKALLLVVSLMFAIQSRNIHLKDFETKNVIVLVYLLSIVSSIGIPVYLILIYNSDNLNAHYAVLCSTLFIGIFICFMTLFFPPVIPIIREKYLGKGSPVYKKKRIWTTSSSYNSKLSEPSTLNSAI